MGTTVLRNETERRLVWISCHYYMRGKETAVHTIK